MIRGQIFVIVVLVLVTATLVTYRIKLSPSVSSVHLQEGAENLQRAMMLSRELTARFGFNFSDDGVRAVMAGGATATAGARAKVSNLGESLWEPNYSWRSLTLGDRQYIKTRLNDLIGSVSQVLKAEAQRGVYLTNKDIVLSWRDSALAYQRSLEIFEKTHGELFDPSRPTHTEPRLGRSRHLEPSILHRTVEAAVDRKI